MSTVQHDSRVISQLHRTLHASNFQTFFLPRPESASPAAILALIAARKRMVACGGEGGRSSYRWRRAWGWWAAAGWRPRCRRRIWRTAVVWWTMGMRRSIGWREVWTNWWGWRRRRRAGPGEGHGSRRRRSDSGCWARPSTTYGAGLLALFGLVGLHVWACGCSLPVFRVYRIPG
jgi:hypothetical protein